MNTMHVSRRVMLAGTAAGCAAAAFEFPAFAAKQADAPFGFKFLGGTGQLLRAPAFAIPSYQVTYFTSHQSTAQADIGVRSRLTATLIGITDQQLRGLTEAAYADLKAQFAAAGIALLPAGEVNAAVVAGGAKLAPGNTEVKDIRGGIAIGGSVRKAYIAMGAADAPMIEGLHRATATGAGGILSRFGAQNQLGDATKKLNAVLFMPSLVIDFADSDAKNGRDFLGRKRAMVNTDLGFTVASTSKVSLSTAMNNARAVAPGTLYLSKDYRVETPFAAVGTKDSLSAVGQAYSSYLPEESERGTLIAVDAPAWEGLVRQAYTAFNATLVAEVVKAQKK
jgi:hypothetical protein